MEFADLAQVSSAFIESRLLQTAVLLGIFDALDAAGPNRMSAAAVAQRLGTHAPATELLMNALVALELLTKMGSEFALAPVAARYLTSAAPHSFAGMIRFDAMQWGSWERLPDAVRTGRPVRLADMYQSDAAETERFIRAMHSLVLARGDAERILPLLGLHAVEHLLDVGSGPGTYPIAFCRAHPQLRATIFDLPGTLAVTRQIVAESGCAERIDLIAGDFRHDPLPHGFDVVFLSNILHGEDEATNQRLACAVAAALRPGGRIVIKDHILDSTLAHPRAGAIFSLQMLLTTGGRDYSCEEVRGWLQAAGFTGIHEIVLEPPLTSSLVVAARA